MSWLTLIWPGSSGLVRVFHTVGSPRRRVNCGEKPHAAGVRLDRNAFGLNPREQSNSTTRSATPFFAPSRVEWSAGGPAGLDMHPGANDRVVLRIIRRNLLRQTVSLMRQGLAGGGMSPGGGG